MRICWGWARVHAHRIGLALLLVVIAFALAQTLPADLALWFGGEILTYVEVVVGTGLAAVMTRFGPVSSIVRAYIGHIVASVQRRSSRHRHSARRLPPPSEGDHRTLSFA